MTDNILFNKIVLVAEDNAINQMVVKHTLLKLGATSDIAGDGTEAIEKFKNQYYDLILMDIQMPQMDGIEATRHIREQHDRQPYIIALTANAMPGDRDACLSSGMDDYLSKPVNLEILTNTLKRLSAMEVVERN